MNGLFWISHSTENACGSRVIKCGKEFLETDINVFECFHPTIHGHTKAHRPGAANSQISHKQVPVVSRSSSEDSWKSRHTQAHIWVQSLQQQPRRRQQPCIYKQFHLDFKKIREWQGTQKKVMAKMMRVIKGGEGGWSVPPAQIHSSETLQSQRCPRSQFQKPDPWMKLTETFLQHKQSMDVTAELPWKGSCLERCVKETTHKAGC